MEHSENKGVADSAILGIRCPECGGEMREVVDSRRVPFGVRRRRECIECGHRNSTRERLEKKKHNR